VANIQADSVTSRETKPSGARGNRPVSDELIVGQAQIDNTVPQKKSTRQETKPFIEPVNPASSSTPVGVKQISSNLLTDVSTVKPATGTSAIIKEPSMRSKVSAGDYISNKLTDFHPAKPGEGRCYDRPYARQPKDFHKSSFVSQEQNASQDHYDEKFTS
jgi:Tfp pilus assembly protein PilP